LPDRRPHRHPGCERQELLAVAAREVRDRAHDTLLPEKLVWKRRDVAHVDAGTEDDAALREHSQGSWHQLADGREDDRGVELFRRPLVRPSRPLRAEPEREALTLVVPRPREREHTPSL